MRGLAAALIAMVLAACASAPDPAADRAAALAFADTWRARYEAKDLPGLMALYEPDAWLMTRNRPAKKGAAAIEAYFRGVMGAPSGARISFTPEDVTIDGRYAFLIAQWRLEAGGTREAGRSLVILKRSSEGRWRLWRDIDNTAPDVTFEAAPSASGP